MTSEDKRLLLYLRQVRNAVDAAIEAVGVGLPASSYAQTLGTNVALAILEIGVREERMRKKETK